MSSSSLAAFFAQVTNAASAAAGTPATGADAAGANQQQGPWWNLPVLMLLFGAMIYFAFLRPQMQATKKKEETIKTAKTGDKVVTSSGIHGLISNVKETTVIVKIADNVKIEVEKSHIDRITRPDAASSDKPAAAKT